MAVPGRSGFLAAIWVTTVFLNAHIIAPAPVFPQLMATYGVGNAAVGALISVLLLSAILAQVPGAYLIDRLNNRRLVALSVLALNGVSLPPLLLPTYEVALVSRFLAGIFVPLVFVGSANLVSEAYPTARARALGVFLASPPAGYALGTFATSAVPPTAGLLFVYVVYALPMLALLPVLHWSSRSLVQDRGPMLPLRAYAAAFRSRELWRLGLAFATTYALYIFFTSWTPAFLVREGVPLVVAGALGALVPALGILSRPLGGQMAEATFRTDKRWVLLLSFAAMVPLSLVWMAPAAVGWALVLLPLAGFFIQLPFAVYYAFSSQILPDRLRGSAYTFMNTTSLLGGVLAPYVAGVLVDATGSFGPAFLFAALLAGGGLLLTATTRER